MFLLFGTRSVSKCLYTGVSFVCPHCNGQIAHFVEVKRYFTFFFIPIFPTGSRYYIICANCGNRAEMDRDSFFNAISDSAAIGNNQTYGLYTQTNAPVAPVQDAVQPAMQTQHMAEAQHQVATEPPTAEEIQDRIQEVIFQTSKKYKKSGWTRSQELKLFGETFMYCPFCGRLSNWSCDNSEGFKFRFRCDSCLGELYGMPRKKPEKNKFQVTNLGYFNKSGLTIHSIYTFDEINKLSNSQEQPRPDQTEHGEADNPE